MFVLVPIAITVILLIATKWLSRPALRGIALAGGLVYPISLIASGDPVSLPEDADLLILFPVFSAFARLPGDELPRWLVVGATAIILGALGTVTLTFVLVSIYS